MKRYASLFLIFCFLMIHAKECLNTFQEGKTPFNGYSFYIKYSSCVYGFEISQTLKDTTKLDSIVSFVKYHNRIFCGS